MTEERSKRREFLLLVFYCQLNKSNMEKYKHIKNHKGETKPFHMNGWFAIKNFIRKIHGAKKCARNEESW